MRKMTCNFRELASHWHSGQWSALYAYSSSGTIEDIDRLLREIYECIDMCEDKQDDTGSLYAFRDWLLEERGDRE